MGGLGSVLFLLRLLYYATGGKGEGHEELPGHKQPIGSHMEPEPVRTISHLPSPWEFHEGFVLPKTPVVIEGALKGSDVWKRWKHDQYLREHFGGDMVDVEQGKKENRSDPRFSIRMDEFLDRYEAEDIYLVGELSAAMYREWEVPRPLSCGGFADHFAYTYMWFSSGGTRSVLHTDSVENFHCLVSGRKEFVLIEPHYASAIGPEHAKKGYFDMDVEKVDMTVYPELSRIPWLRAVVEEGDCLYLPYLWMHTVNSFGRNMGVNIWWMQFDFDASDCPSSEAELPQYFPLGNVQLSPEMVILEALGRCARQDGSVHASDMYTLVHETAEGMDYLTLHHVETLFDLLQPGCNGVITDYKAILKPQIVKGYEYVASLGPEVPEDELYDPSDEFGGQEMYSDPDHAMEGGGDFEFQHQRDEL